MSQVSSSLDLAFIVPISVTAAPTSLLAPVVSEVSSTPAIQSQSAAALQTAAISMTPAPPSTSTPGLLHQDLEVDSFWRQLNDFAPKSDRLKIPTIQTGAKDGANCTAVSDEVRRILNVAKIPTSSATLASLGVPILNDGHGGLVVGQSDLHVVQNGNGSLVFSILRPASACNASTSSSARASTSASASTSAVSVEKRCGLDCLTALCFPHDGCRSFGSLLEALHLIP